MGHSIHFSSCVDFLERIERCTPSKDVWVQIKASELSSIFLAEIMECIDDDDCWWLCQYRWRLHCLDKSNPQLSVVTCFNSTCTNILRILQLMWTDHRSQIVVVLFSSLLSPFLISHYIHGQYHTLTFNIVNNSLRNDFLLLRQTNFSALPNQVLKLK